MIMKTIMETTVDRNNIKPFQRHSSKYSSLPANFTKNYRNLRNGELAKSSTSESASKMGGNTDWASKKLKYSLWKDDYKTVGTSHQPYKTLAESSDDLSSSVNLSSESIRNACEYYEDNEYGLQSIEKEKRVSEILAESMDNGTTDVKLFAKSGENTIQLDALNILEELDAVLDYHDVSQTNTQASDYQDKVADCLMDLDLYLEEIDRSIETVSNVQDSNWRNRSNKWLQKNQSFENLTLPKMKSPDFNEKKQCLKRSLSADVIRDLKLNRHCSLFLSKNNSDRSTIRRQVDVLNEISQRETSNPLCQALTEEQIMNTLLQNEAKFRMDNRPRQFGRRGLGSSQQNCSTFCNSLDLSRMANQQRETQNCHRPFSAPATSNSTNHTINSFAEGNYTLDISSDASSIHSSCVPSPITVSSTSNSISSDNIESQAIETDEMPTLNVQSISNFVDPNNPSKSSFNQFWPNSYSRGLALLCCTLGLFNISRFSILTVNYGMNFLIQFVILSILFGVPLFWLQMCLGAKIKSGPVSMWKISPICAGIGVALTLVQFVMAIYSTVSIAWILVYLRDTFPTKHSLYRWEETIYSFKHPSQSVSNLTENVADYFNILVLQRIQLANRFDVSGIRFRVNDRLAFYLAFIWTFTFLIICKGLKSFGKLVLILGSLPLLSLVVVTIKLILITKISNLENFFGANDFDDFLINSKTWGAAAQETFLTWGLMGASVVAITSRTYKANCATSLRTESIFVVLLTVAGLITTAILGLCCRSLLKESSYIYVPGSFEKQDVYASIYSLESSSIPNNLVTFPTKLMPHHSSFVGETYRRPNSLINKESGYQALRLITELYPAAVAIASDKISWIWTAVGFVSFAMFGLGQLCVMWKPISNALGDSTSSVLLSCVTGLLLSIPFATEMGISILYYTDFLVGGSWIVPVLWASLIFGVFLVRGRPYNGDDLVNDLHMCGSLSAFLALSWNLLLPIGLIVLSSITYKISLSNQFYFWRDKAYFSYWARKSGSLLQIGILLLIPVISIIQIYRYLTSGPPDILDRIQNLYRPPEGDDNRHQLRRSQLDPNRNNIFANENIDERSFATQNDAPPKYTPPPSYTTATGARLAKLLRQSIRRSIRRIIGEPERIRPSLTVDQEETDASTAEHLDRPFSLPIESRIDNLNPRESEVIDIEQRQLTHISVIQRSFSVDRKKNPKKTLQSQTINSTPFAATTSLNSHFVRQRPFTADDVVQVLRSSIRNSRNDVLSKSNEAYHESKNSFRSEENLILNAEPPGESPAIASIRTNNCEIHNLSIEDDLTLNNNSVI